MINSMDSVFGDLDDTARSSFLLNISRSFGCSYVCLWSYHSVNTCLVFMDGCYNDQDPTLPSTSSTGGAGFTSSLFNQYCNQPIFLLHPKELIPGFAFQHSLPYMEINDLDLLRMASSDVQRQFYQEARIKTAVFMGCNVGEIELGFSNTNAQINREMEMRSLFPENFSGQQPVVGDQIPRPPDPKSHNSSSSSSFRSLSTESPEYSSLVFNLNPSPTGTSYTIPDTALRPMSTSSATMAAPIQEALARLRNPQLPTMESEHAQMTRAILAVLSSSPSPSSSSSSQPRPQNTLCAQNPNATAFKKYSSSLLSPTRRRAIRTSMFKRSVTYFRNLNIARMAQFMQSQGQNRPPSATQLHHVMSERKRREKLNDSFQALRSLLPPGSKKDKASVLTSTREYLSSLREEVMELRERNLALEERVRLMTTDRGRGGDEEVGGSSNDERVNVRIRQVSESTTSDEGMRTAELVVSVRGGSTVDLVIRILEFIKRVNNVSLVSLEANHLMVTDSTAINRIVLTLQIQGGEWDEPAFQEAVKRVASD